MQEASFDPYRIALVESAPALALTPQVTSGEVRLERYEGERLSMAATLVSNSLLVLGEKYHKGWKATVDGKSAEIVPVNHILRGVYLTPGKHTVEFRFDPLPFKVGKWLTLGSFALFGIVAVREWWLRRREHGSTV